MKGWMAKASTPLGSKPTADAVGIGRRQVLRAAAIGVGAAATSGLASRCSGLAAAAPEGAVNALENGVSGDGVTDDHEAIQNLIQAYGGKRPIAFPAGRYRLGTPSKSKTNRITMPSGTHLVFADEAVIEINAVDGQPGTAVFFAGGADGTKAPLSVEAVAGGQSVELPIGTGADFSVGDIIGLESNGIAGEYEPAGPWYVREFHEIMSTNSGTLHLDSPLEYSYLPTESAVFWKVNTINDIVIEGATFECGPGIQAGVDHTYPIRLSKVKNFTLDRLKIRKMTGGISIHDCYNGSIGDCSVDGLPSYETSFGYGVHIAGSSARIEIDNLRGSDNRHLFTTLADQRGGTFWGGPMHVRVNNGVGRGAEHGYAVWDTHEFGRHIEFNNCLALGGGIRVTGFQIRAQDVSLNNCSAVNNGFRGVHLHDRSKRVSIHGGEFGHAGAQGIAIAGIDHQVVGSYIHGCRGAGVALINSEEPLIQGCSISNNAYGLQDGGSETAADAPLRASVNARIKDCVIPYSATQMVSIANLSVSAVAEDLICLGYKLMGGMYDSVGKRWGAPDGAKYSILTNDGWISNALPSSSLGGG